MIKKIPLAIITVFLAADCLAQNVQTLSGWKPGAFEYFLPKKVLIVKATFTLTKTTVVRVLKKANKDGDFVIEPDKDSHPTIVKKESFSAVIKDPITITEVVVADETPYYVDFSKLTRGGKGYKLAFAGTSQGVLQGVNAEQTPVTAEIIGGVLGFVTKVVSVAAQGVAAGVFGVASGDFVPTKDDEVQTESQTVEITRIIDFTETDGKVVFDTKFGDDFKTIPVLTITFSSLTKSEKEVKDLITSFPVDGVVYRKSVPYKVSLTVENNGFVKKAEVLTTVVDLPQKGALSAVPIPIAKGKKTSAIAFDISTGRVTKFENNKESVAEATFSKINSATEELGKAAIELRKAQDQRKDKPVQDQIDKLTLDNQLLESQILNEQKKKALEKEKSGAN